MSTPTTHIQFLAPNAVRITHTPTPAPLPDRPWLAHVLLPQPPLATPPQLHVAVEGERIWIRDSNGATVLREAQTPTFGPDGRIQLGLATFPDEGFYGWGEWFNGFRRTRGRIQLETRESQAHNQWRQTYSNIPIFLSDRGYAFWLLNSHRSDWRFERGLLQIAADGPPADYVVIYGPTFKTILTTYTRLSGRPPLLPRWAFGLWVTGYPQEPQHVVLERVAEHRRRGIPLDGVILDYHWEERFHNFRWRPSLFPDPQGMLERLRAMQCRLGLIFTPFVNRTNHRATRVALNLLFQNIAAGEERADERALDLYDEGLRNGFFAHPNAWWWLGRGGMVDFTNPQAATWWNQLLRPLYQQGITLFKNDDGEYLPPDARSQIGIDGREYHNIYGFFYGRAIYNGMADSTERRPMIYARSVWAGSQRYPALFLGDQKPTFGHIRATMRAGLNMSLLGFAYWTPDVFGLDGKTTEETHMRYAQWALLAPVARYFWRPPQIDPTRLPWSHGARAEANFRRYALLRSRLLPYFATLAWEAWQTGLPIMRPMILEFQDDPQLRAVDDQVMLGAALLIAPVTRARATQRQVRLPAGTWHDFWSTRSYGGPATIQTPAPLETLPILVRGGSIIPFGPERTSTPDNLQFTEIALHCWPPYPAQIELYDDDGQTLAYQQGTYRATPIRVEGDARRIQARIGPSGGDPAYQIPMRHINFVFERSSAPQQVQINGQTTHEWQHDAVQRRLSIPLVCPADAETTVEVWYNK